ncbi:MAG: tRNA (guanosine(46)-N7)-methyltransferase TrmB [Bacteroidetes bacterium HGW-Bacteroidetes-4]|nr:MAG: tRNA (guanosine(46)-N7)-methyltransferase TrmB [Bacteroidetes bacterium HGW-Bacteroidetes-4]
MGKGKLKKFQDNARFEHVIEPEVKGHVANDHPLKGNWNTVFFKNKQPLVLELGCGKGEYSVGLARMFPEKNFIGVDIKGARIWKGAKTSFEEGLKNVAFLRTRIEVINSFFAPNEVDEIWVTFPDPQMKKRRAKKRLTSSGFLTRYQKFIKNNALVHLKTDSTFLYEYTNEVVRVNQLKVIKNTPNLYSESWTDQILSIQTHYEQIHIDEGDRINYIVFELPQNQVLIEPEFDGED